MKDFKLLFKIVLLIVLSIAIVLTVFWIKSDPSEYEPWTVLLGFVATWLADFFSIFDYDWSNVKSIFDTSSNSDNPGCLSDIGITILLSMFTGPIVIGIHKVLFDSYRIDFSNFWEGSVQGLFVGPLCGLIVLSIVRWFTPNRNIDFWVRLLLFSMILAIFLAFI